jgi:hypothetical protein
MFDTWTPDCSPPPGYKLLIHRYYTEIVPIELNVPKTPIKKHRFFYDNIKDIRNIRDIRDNRILDMCSFIEKKEDKDETK